tara:strand:+ start:31 stop:1125 length:1095 start_codon:yes stop_codon:yes gene_type:complete
MSLWIQKKWVNQISSSLDRFKWVDNNVANCRCPLCGDSDYSEFKARGYFFVHKNTYIYKCHNCGFVKPLGKFIEIALPQYYKEYKLDMFKESSSMKLPTKESNKPEAVARQSGKSLSDRLSRKSEDDSKTNNELIIKDNGTYSSILNLPNKHPAVQYLLSRKIPKSKWDKIYYTDNYRKFIFVTFPDLKSKYKRLPKDRRIIFFMMSEDGKSINALQGRSIEDNPKIRYLTIKINENATKTFGLDSVDFNKPIFVLEGIIDALFLPNSIALCGGDVSYSLNSFPRSNTYILLDNEKRSQDTLNRMKKAIDMGFYVTFWTMPQNLKDINKMILNGFTVKDILHDVKINSFKGLQAKAKFTFWKKG